MTFEVWIAGPLKNWAERLQMGRIVPDLNKRFRESNQRVILVIEPEVGGSRPDLLLSVGGVPLILELKSTDEPFMLRLKAGVSDARPIWVVPSMSKFKQTLDPFGQTRAHREAFEHFVNELPPSLLQTPREFDPTREPAAWGVVQPGSKSGVDREPPDAYRWFELVPIDELSDRLTHLEGLLALPDGAWDGILRRLSAERVPIAGEWWKILLRRHPQDSPVETNPEVSTPAPAPTSADLVDTIQYISRNDLREYADWLVGQLSCEDGRVRAAALSLLLNWKSPLVCPTLVRDLSVGTREDREFALTQLRSIRCPEAVPEIRRALTSAALPLHQLIQALITCAGSDSYGDVVSLAHRMISDRLDVEDERWRSVVEGLGRFSGDAPARELIELFRASPNLPSRLVPDGGDSLRSSIMDVLGRSESAFASAFLITELEGSSADGLDLIRALTLRPHPTAVAALAPYLESPDEPTRHLVIRALVLAGTPASTAILLKKLETLLLSGPVGPDSDWEAERLFTELLPTARQKLERMCCRVLDTGHAANTMRALQTLSFVANRSSIPTLSKLLEDPQYSDFVAEILGEIADSGVQKRGLELIESPNELLRSAGVRMVAQARSDEVVSALVPLEDDPSPLVRRAVVDVYGRWDSAALRHRLLKLMADPTPDVRRAGMWASSMTPISDRRGCRLIAIGKSQMVGQLWVNDACLVLSTDDQLDPAWVVPFDGVKSHAYWDVAEGNRGIWLATQTATGQLDIVLEPSLDGPHPWVDSQIVAREWYPRIENALPNLGVSCSGRDWQRVRDRLPRNR